VKRDMHQYNTGTYWTSGLLSYGRSVVLKSITIINNNPSVQCDSTGTKEEEEEVKPKKFSKALGGTSQVYL
jgi:hypothetical protein